MKTKNLLSDWASGKTYIIYYRHFCGIEVYMTEGSRIFTNVKVHPEEEEDEEI